MTSRSLRRFAPLAIVGVVAAVASGCASVLADAATVRFHDPVGGHVVHLGRSDFDGELEHLLANKRFVDLLKQNQFAVTRENADTRVAAIWLGGLIQQAAIDAEFEQRHLKVLPADEAQAKQQEEQEFGGRSVLAGFSRAFRDKLLARRARLDAVLRSYSTPTAADVRRYYDTHRTELSQCQSGRLVAQILVSKLEDAQQIVTQLRAGTSFAALARQRSIDPITAQQGGQYGCLLPNEFVPEFQQAAESAPFDEPTEPVQTQYGYHVILITHFSASFDALRAQILQHLEQSGASEALEARLKAMKVEVDPRYGTWGLVTNAQGQQRYQVTPPSAPSVRDQREHSRP